MSAMTAPQRRFLEMAVALARSVRRGRDAELARAAADFEIQWQRELDEEPGLRLIAAEPAPKYGDDDEQKGAAQE